MNDKVEKSLKFSFKDGLFASGMAGFTQDYLTPFLLVLGGKRQARRHFERDPQSGLSGIPAQER